MAAPLTIVVPMAGRGSRFSLAGYTQPKPLIPVHDVPMIRLVIENLRPSRDHRFIFICQREHVRENGLGTRLLAWAPGALIVEIDGVTEGAACTVLAACEEIDGAGPLMIANCDQYVDTNIDDYLEVLDQGYDGLIMTMAADDPKWSYVQLDDAGLVTNVVEKQVVSNEATVGIYSYARGDVFVAATHRMIAQGKRVNGEFYVAPVYNEMIADGSRVAISNIGSENSGMYGLGIPEDLDRFLALPIARRAIASLR